MHKDCTIYRTADFIGKRWTLILLLELAKDDFKEKRYSDLKRSIKGITPKLLSQRLKELEDERLVKKTINTDTFPVRCNYTLTKPGKDFFQIIKKMKSWALKWKIKNKSCENSDCLTCHI